MKHKKIKEKYILWKLFLDPSISRIEKKNIAQNCDKIFSTYFYKRVNEKKLWIIVFRENIG